MIESPPAGAASSFHNRSIRVAFGRFCRKEIQAEGRVEFSAETLDPFGIPRPVIHYGLTDLDQATIDAARHDPAAVGRPVFGLPRLLPAGTSLHCQGSVRMGPRLDGTSDCDPSSRVWETDNLFVGSNGVIPTATACNPTLTSVAFACLAAPEVLPSAQLVRPAAVEG